MNRSPEHRWLHRYAVLTAVVTFCLVWVGGLVTSKGAGLAVPDWPTTYGYNMFLFPISKWTGGILYEHSHRLVASLVGLLTVILAVWLWLQESRRWLRHLGVLAVVLVISQGVLGGLRVTALKDELGIFHATLAQLFFILICSIALFTSPWWNRAARERSAASPASAPVRGARGFRRFSTFTTLLILAQLILGASMRHQHAGLAIPDFPAAYGHWWPTTDDASVARYNQARVEVVALNPITAAQIHLQMVHRATAAMILMMAIVGAIVVRRRFRWNAGLMFTSHALLILVLLQASLGAATIWSNKAADIATGHVAVGALCFMTSVLTILIAARTMVEGVEPGFWRTRRPEFAPVHPGIVKA